MSSENKDRTFVNGNTFFISDTFDDEMRNVVIWNLEKQIEDLKTKKDATITFYISSHGGDGFLVMDMVNLFEYAKSWGIKIRTIVTSHAYSAGSILAIAGTEGERYISRNAEHLAHYGTFDGRRKHTPVQSTREHERNLRWNETMIAHYEKYAKIPNIRKELADDGFYIPADKSIEWKLADKYFEELFYKDKS